MRVLLTNFHPGHGGGHHTYIRSLLIGLKGKVEFGVAVPRSSAIFQAASDLGVPVFDQSFPGNFKETFQVVRSVFRLDSIYRRFPFDVLHCNGSRDHWIALYWKTLFRRPVRIIRSRHALKKTKNNWVHDWAQNRATLKNIYVSNGMIPLCEKGGLHLRNACVIENGIDLNHYRPQLRDSALAQSLGIEPDYFVIGSAAGLGRYKRVDLMLRAIHELGSETSKVRILLLGQEGSAQAFLKLSDTLGIRSQVIYAGMQPDVRPYLSLFHAGFVLSTDTETSSFAAREMMAMGVPLICSRFSGLVDVVDDGLNGYFVEPGNLESVKQATRRVLNLSPNQMNDFRLQARAKAERCFGWERSMKLLEACYREAIIAS